MAKNRVFFQFPAVNDSLDQLCRKREQQKAKRCCRELEQNFSHLPNSVKDKAEFCFQKCFHISRSDFRSISSSSIWPHIAPKDAFFMFLSYHVFVILQPSFRIFPQIYTFASSQTFRQAPLFFRTSHKQSAWHRPDVPASAAFYFRVPTSALRDIAPDVPASAAFSFKVPTSYLRGIAPTFRQAPLFGQKILKRCNAAYWDSRAAHLSRRVSLIFCFILQ